MAFSSTGHDLHPRTATSSFPDSILEVSNRPVKHLNRMLKFHGICFRVPTRTATSLPPPASRAADHLRELSQVAVAPVASGARCVLNVDARCES